MYMARAASSVDDVLRLRILLLKLFRMPLDNVHLRLVFQSKDTTGEITLRGNKYRKIQWLEVYEIVTALENKGSIPRREIFI